MIWNRRTHYSAGGGLSVCTWLVLQLMLLQGAERAAADELVGEIQLGPLAGQPEQSQNGFEPLWQLSPDGGPVYGVIAESDFLVIARSRTPETQLLASAQPLTVSLSPESEGRRWLAAPVGATVLLEGTSGRALTVQIEGTPEPLLVEPGQQQLLPIEAMAQQGWLVMRVVETGREIQILKIDSAFLPGQTRLRGSGRLVIEFEGEVEHGGALELELSIDLWFRGRQLCAPDVEGTACEWHRTGDVRAGRVHLAPVVLEDSEWSLLPEGP